MLYWHISPHAGVSLHVSARKQFYTNSEEVAQMGKPVLVHLCCIQNLASCSGEGGLVGGGKWHFWVSGRQKRGKLGLQKVASEEASSTIS